MQYTILLDKRENTKEVEKQEQARFIKTILESLEVPIEWDPDEPLTIESKLKLRKDFETYNINVINDNDGGIKVFANRDLIGDWFKPHYVLRQDYSQINPNKKLYLEMHINFWTVFEK